LLRKATSCFGCSTNANESVVLTSAAVLYRKRMSNMSNFEIIQQQQHVHNPDIRKVLISLS